MSKFIDAAGNEWNVHLDVETIRRVRQETEFSFGTCLNDDMQAWWAMLDDYELLPTVMTAILKPQWMEKGLTETTMLNNIAGDAIEHAQQAIWDAFAFFCPPPTRTMLQQLRTATEKMSETQLEQATQMMETFTSKPSSSEPLSESTPEPIAIES